MDSAPGLERHGVLGRFDPPAEAAYQRWYVERFRPLGIAMAALSLVAWVINPILIVLFMETEHNVLMFVVSYGVNIPALVAGLVYLRRPDPRWALPAATAILILTAVDLIVVILPFVPNLDPSAFALAATFFGLLGPMIQLPFRLTVLTGVVITAAGELAVLRSADAHENVLLPVLFVALSLFLSPAMAFANERDLRTRYANERLIDQQRMLVRRYAPSSVVSRIELGDHTVDHPQRRKVTVFFSDVVGFTSMADRVDPEALADIVNEYLGALADLIERHGGTLNEFAGDGVMAIFGAPDEMDPEAQVTAALAAARELQTSLPEWSRSWYQHGILEDAKARVGINTGTVSVGTFGSAVRATYTGIGLQTNIAARVQAQAEPGGILLSNTSWHLVKDGVPCEPRGEVMVKGVHFPIGLYAPLPT
ncbi:MAG: adenylate/guanylate cyclase domain-containing protein [Marmoricola sp.]